MRQYRDFCGATDDVTLRRPGNGNEPELTVNGERHKLGRIASAFPLSSSKETIVFFDREGEEIVVMKQAEALDSESSRVLEEELEKAYFMPRVEAILQLEESLGVETWTVQTDKGKRTFEVRSPRHNVRKLGKGQVVIKDVDSNRYEVPNWRRLDRKSLFLLMRHL